MAELIIAMRYFALLLVGLMAVGAIAVLILKLVLRQPKRMMTESCVLVLPLSALGIFSFLAGLGLAFSPEQKYARYMLPLLGGGFLLLCGSIALNAVTAKAKRGAWLIVPARCMERKLRRVHTATDEPVSWRWELVCEMSLAGKTYRVAPSVGWSDVFQRDAVFGTEEKAQLYLAEKISPEGECKLRVNPSNPLESELPG